VKVFKNIKDSVVMPQKKTNSNNSEKQNQVYCVSLELENVRCFGEKQKINFSDGENTKRWTIILGNNGTGKTTILQTIVSSLPGKFSVNVAQNSVSLPDSLVPIFPIIDNRYPNWFLTRSKNTDFINIKSIFSYKSKLIDKDNDKNQFSLNISINNDGKITLGSSMSFKGFEKANCFAYGASRRSGETSLVESDWESDYETLFNETKFLKNPEEWFLQKYIAYQVSSNGKRKYDFQIVKDILTRILPEITDIRIVEKSGNNKFSRAVVEFYTPYGWVEARDLSLGYRTSMAWMVDFASRMFDLYPESENPLAEPAVVLIDEIDLHLHPKWQRDLLPWLSELFPNTQFIVTTHSPLIVQSAVARDANIVVCRREGDHVVIDQSVEAVKNWRADQILTSDLFGLETARPKEIEPFLEERQEILSKAKLTKKDEKRLKMLESEIGFMPVGENPEDDKAMDIIRRAAERLQSEAK